MSNDKDIVVGSTSFIPNGPPTKQIPSYLVKMIKASKTDQQRFFIAVGEPNMNQSFIHVKGFFSDATEDDIVVGYKELLAAATQAQTLEMWLPWHTVQSVRSLVFKTSSKK
jgi:hypothetical protein